MVTGYDIQKHDSSLEKAVRFFDDFERLRLVDSDLVVNDAAEKLGKRYQSPISLYEMFSYLSNAISYLGNFNKKDFQDMGSAGIPCMNVLSWAMQDERLERQKLNVIRNKIERGGQTSLREFSAVDFQRYAVMIEGYRNLLRYENTYGFSALEFMYRGKEKRFN